MNVSASTASRNGARRRSGERGPASQETRGTTHERYDLLVIGSGPAGQKAAIQAAKLGKRVALVERRELGGVSVNWGTIPSKTLREAIVYLTGLEPAGDLRPELPREGRDHDRGSPPANAGR